MREQIYTELWNLVLEAIVSGSSFVTALRYLIPISEMQPSFCPALFLVEHGEQHVRSGKGIPDKRTLQCSLVAYAFTENQKTVLPATLLNNMMDGLDNILNNVAPQTLGGLVEHVYLEGEVKIFEAQIGAGNNGSVLVAPIAILIP